MVLQGIGKSPRYPFVTLYIDDTVEKRETGFYMGEFYPFSLFVRFDSFRPINNLSVKQGRVFMG